jgi:hypothetical protein
MTRLRIATGTTTPPRAASDIAKTTVPQGHPLEMWTIETAALRCGDMDVETLRRSQCPRAKVGGRVMFDPIETIAWFRTFLDRVVSSDAMREAV